MAGSNKTIIQLAWLIGLIAVTVRMIAITQPFIDDWSWRESDVAAIARNYYENNFQFAYPQIDWAGDAPGYVGTEFPLQPFAVALIYKFAGVRDWIGRAESIFFFAGSLLFFYLFVRRLFGDESAMWALFFYSFAPLGIVASRAFIPDVASLSFSLAGLYFFLCWAEERKWRDLLGAAFTISLGILIKAPNAIIGLPLLYLMFVAAVYDRRTQPGKECGGHLGKECDGHRPPLQKILGRVVRSPELWLFATIALLPSMVWYWHARQIAAHYYPYHFFGAGGFEIMNLNWYAEISWRVVTRSLTPVLSLLALAGVFIPPRRKYAHVFHWWFGAMVAFVFFVGYGNRHPWYQLPLVPIAAVFAGVFVVVMSSRIQQLIVRRVAAAGVLLLFGCSSLLYTRAFYTPASSDLYELGLHLHEITPRDARIIAADGGDPTLFYYAHRKGWHFLEKNGVWNNLPLNSAEAISNLEELRKRGATYVVFPFRTRWWLDYYGEFAMYLNASTKPIEVTSRFAIYKL